jgi:hypothetical protein
LAATAVKPIFQNDGLVARAVLSAKHFLTRPPPLPHISNSCFDNARTLYECVRLVLRVCGNLSKRRFLFDSGLGSQAKPTHSESILGLETDRSEII